MTTIFKMKNIIKSEHKIININYKANQTLFMKNDIRQKQIKKMPHDNIMKNIFICICIQAEIEGITWSRGSPMRQ